MRTPYGEDQPSVGSTCAPHNAPELVDVAGWRTFRQASLAEVYESQITVGVGVRARCRSACSPSTVPGRVHALSSTSRTGGEMPFRDEPSAAGGMFWLSRNRLVGS